jgi:hypothetical protein
MYEHGQGMPAGFSKAAEFYTLAAQHGSVNALSNLASLYQHGTGVPQDLQKATKLYTMAAEKGVFPAQRYLAGAYLTATASRKIQRKPQNGCSLLPRAVTPRRNVISRSCIKPESACRKVIKTPCLGIKRRRNKDIPQRSTISVRFMQMAWEPRKISWKHTAGSSERNNAGLKMISMLSRFSSPACPRSKSRLPSNSPTLGLPRIHCQLLNDTDRKQNFASAKVRNPRLRHDSRAHQSPRITSPCHSIHFAISLQRFASH